MPKSVYKYILTIHDYQKIEMPKGSNILTVQIQKEDVCIWALVNKEEKETEIRYFRIAGTGHSIEDKLIRYIGTFQLRGGDYIGHLFEIEEHSGNFYDYDGEHLS